MPVSAKDMQRVGEIARRTSSAGGSGGRRRRKKRSAPRVPEHTAHLAARFL